MRVFPRRHVDFGRAFQLPVSGRIVFDRDRNRPFFDGKFARHPFDDVVVCRNFVAYKLDVVTARAAFFRTGSVIARSGRRAADKLHVFVRLSVRLVARDQAVVRQRICGRVTAVSNVFVVRRNGQTYRFYRIGAFRKADGIIAFDKFPVSVAESAGEYIFVRLCRRVFYIQRNLTFVAFDKFFAARRIFPVGIVRRPRRGDFARVIGGLRLNDDADIARLNGKFRFSARGEVVFRIRNTYLYVINRRVDGERPAPRFAAVAARRNERFSVRRISHGKRKAVGGDDFRVLNGNGKPLLFAVILCYERGKFNAYRARSDDVFFSPARYRNVVVCIFKPVLRQLDFVFADIVQILSVANEGKVSAAVPHPERLDDIGDSMIEHRVFHRRDFFDNACVGKIFRAVAVRMPRALVYRNFNFPRQYGNSTRRIGNIVIIRSKSARKRDGIRFFHRVGFQRFICALVNDRADRKLVKAPARNGNDDFAVGRRTLVLIIASQRRAVLRFRISFQHEFLFIDGERKRALHRVVVGKFRLVVNGVNLCALYFEFSRILADFFKGIGPRGGFVVHARGCCREVFKNGMLRPVVGKVPVGGRNRYAEICRKDFRRAIEGR